MRDYITLGPTPRDEDCARHRTEAHREVNRYIKAIEKTLGKPPDGASLGIHVSYEVCCWYDTENLAAKQYAFDCKSRGPTTWPENKEGI